VATSTDLLLPSSLVAHAQPGESVTADREAIRESPLILGVLGHRELDPARVPRLRDAMVAFIAEIREHLPETELHATIGLTHGCDVQYVRGALDFASHVEVLLPMPLEECASDFDADALQTLRALFTDPKVSSTVLSAPVQPLGIGGSEETRHAALYANLTETLVRRSSVLLTLWDGHPPLRGVITDAALRHVGVRAAAADADVSLVMLDLADDVDTADSLVHWTPGTGNAGTPSQACPRMPPQLARQLVDLNTYNRDYRRLRAQGRIRTPNSLLAAMSADVPLDDRPVLEAIDSEYGKADALALHYQARSDRLFSLFAIMAFTMGLTYLTYDKLAHRSLLLVSYLVVLLCSLCLYYALRGQRWFAKHLGYRALAETLRVTFYLRVAGVDHRLDVARVLALSGINRFRGFSLITHVLAALAVPDTHAADRRAADVGRSRCVERDWIEGQHRYFVVKVSRLKREGRRVRALKNALFANVLLVIVAMVVSDQAMEHYEILFGVSLKDAVTFGWGFLALLLGAWQLHDNNKASRELLLQYRNQGGHFARARQHLSRLVDADERNHILLELGRNSLMESYLWTIHRYHREHEPAGKH
jgi:hypothetical protein